MEDTVDILDQPEVEQSNEPIYKTSDGQTVTHTQLLASGYDEDRISKGLKNNVITKIGDTQDPNQTFQTKDGQKVTTQQLIQSGYTQDRIDKGVHNGILSPLEKKNQSGNVGSTTLSNTKSVGATPSIGNVGEDSQIPIVDINSDPHADNIELSKKYGQLKESVVNNAASFGGIGSDLSSMVNNKEASDIKDFMVNIRDVDPDELYNETGKLTDADYQRIPKEQLLQHREENRPLYNREVSHLNWRREFGDKLKSDVEKGNITPELAENVDTGIKQIINAASGGQYADQRDKMKDIAAYINTLGGENKSQIQKDFAVEASKVYGNSYKNGFDKVVTDAPESKYITSPNALLGYQYIKDMAPDRAAQYERLFIDPKSLKDKPDEQKGYNHLMQTLEETGLGLQQNAVTEDLNDLNAKAKANGGLTPEQLDQAKQLEAKNDELAKQQQELDDKYPERKWNKVSDAAQEIMGQDIGYGNYAVGKTGLAFKHTGQGIWEAVSSPFMSDESNLHRELALMGQNMEENEIYHTTDENKNFKTDKLVIEPELQKQIDEIKNEKNTFKADNMAAQLVSDAKFEANKKQKIYGLLYENRDKFSRVPITNGKFDPSPSSILYGVTDIGTSLLPFIGLEAVTGGGATASATRKFISTFTAAAATGFHDEYTNAVESGLPQSEAYKQAMGITAINSFAMAGANTPEAIRAMAKGNTSAGKLIASMSDEAIEKVLAKGTPKGLKAIAGTIKERLMATPKMAVEGLKTGAKFEAAMTGAKELEHQIYNTPIDREQNFKQSLLNIANFGLMGAGLGHLGYKSPSELQKSGLVEFGKKPDEYLAIAEQMRKDGQLTQEQFDHRKNLIDLSKEAYKSLPKANDKGKALTEKEKAEYLYNNVIKSEGYKASKNLPPKQAEKAEMTAMVADHKNDLILNPQTGNQLEARRSKLEKSLEKKDENGKSELNDKERTNAQSELTAITQHIEEKKKEADTRLSQPIEGLDEQGIPLGDNVPAEVKGNDVSVGEKNSELTDISHEEVKRQMQPITDKMADIEREFKNNGYDINWDYDNEIQVSDKKGEQVEPNELPENLKSLAADYEKGTQKLADFDHTAYHQSLEESRKRIAGEEIPHTDVSVGDVGNNKENEIAAIPDIQPIADRAKQGNISLEQELRERIDFQNRHKAQFTTPDNIKFRDEKIAEYQGMLDKINEINDKYDKPSLPPTADKGGEAITGKEPTIEGLNRADAKKVYNEVRQLDEPTDAKGLALAYLAHGGKVGEDAINEVAGTVKRASLNTGAKEAKSSEVKARDYSDKSGKGIDAIVHNIWDNLSEEVQGKVDIQDIKDELMAAIGNHTTRLSAAKEYIKSYGVEEPTFAEEKNITDEEHRLNDWLNSQSKVNHEHENISDNETLNIINHDTENEKSNQQPATETTSTGSSGNRKDNSEKEKQNVNDETKTNEVHQPAENKEHPNKVPPETGSETKIGKFEAKARIIADKINNSKLPSWLSIDDPTIKKQGVGADELKKLLADATIKMGQLLDKGVEFSKAVKEAVKDLVDAMGKDKQDDIEAGFAQHYKDNEGIKEIGTKKALNDALREEMGLQPLELPKHLTKDEGVVRGKELVDSGENKPLETINYVLDNKNNPNAIKISPDDEFGMIYYERQLAAERDNLNSVKIDLENKVKSEPDNEEAKGDLATVTQKLLNNYDAEERRLNASQLMGNVGSKYFNARQISVDERGLVVNSINRIKTIYGDDIPEAIKKQLSELQIKYDDLTARNLKIEKEHADAQAENELLKQKLASKSKGLFGTKRAKKTDAEFAKERDNIIAKMKEDVAKMKGNTFLTVPGFPQLGAAAPHIMSLVRNLAEQGLNKIDDVVDKIHELVKDTITGVTKNDIRDVIAGKYNDKTTRDDLVKQIQDLKNQAKRQLKNKDANFSAEEIKKQIQQIKDKIKKGEFSKPQPIKRTFENNENWKKNNQELIKVKKQLRDLEYNAYQSKKSMYMRGLDWVNRWGRRVIFFGANAIYTKLSSAAVLGSFIHRPFEQIAGKINTKLYPHIAKNAPIEGYINLAAELKFYGEFLNPVKFLKQTWQIGKTGESSLSKELSSYTQKHHIPILDLFAADAHIMIKDPVKRATFEAAQMNTMKYYADNGIDGTHPLMIEAARQAAYKTAEGEIFQNSQKEANKVGQFFRELEKSGVLNNAKPDTWSKVKGNTQYTVASLYHFFVPVNTVPLNIAKKIWQGNPVSSIIRTGKAWAQNNAIRDGILNMSQDEANLIMNQLKKGRIGSAYWTLGLIVGASALGGAYSKYNPDNKKKGLKSEEMKVGSIDVPKNAQHNTQLQSAQMGATYREVYDHYINDKGASVIEASAAALAATGGAIADQLPTVKEAGKIIGALRNPSEGKAFVTDLKRRVGIGKGMSLLQMMGYANADEPQQEFLGHKISEPTDEHIKDNYSITDKDDLKKFKEAREKSRLEQMKELTDYGATFIFNGKEVHLDLKDEDKLQEQLKDKNISKTDFDEALTERLSDIGKAASTEAKKTITVKEKPKLVPTY